MDNAHAKKAIMMITRIVYANNVLSFGNFIITKKAFLK